MRSAKRLQSNYTESTTIVHLSTATGWRGGEQQLAYLIEELEERSIPQILMCPQDSKLEEFCIQRSIPYYSYNKGKLFQLGFAKEIDRIVKSTPRSILHSHDSHSHTAAYIAFRLFGVRSPLVVSRRVDFQIGKNLMSKWKYNATNISSIICVSEAIKEIIRPDIQKQELITTVHSGIDLNKFRGIADLDLHREFDISKSKKIVGNTSAISDHKDYYTFIDTAAKILKQDKDVHFLIVGDGPMREEIEIYSVKCGLQNDITFSGFRTDVTSILPGFDVFLFPSKTEGLGTSVLDAFAAGVPVVATTAGGIPEMVIPEVTGLACPVADSDCLSSSVIRILNDKSLAEQVIKAAKKKLTEFDKSNTAVKTLDVYKRTEENYFGD